MSTGYERKKKKEALLEAKEAGRATREIADAKNNSIFALPETAGKGVEPPENETPAAFIDRLWDEEAPSIVADKAKKGANPAQANPAQANPAQANPAQANSISTNPTSANPTSANKWTEQKPLFMGGDSAVTGIMPSLRGEGVTPATPEPATPEPATPEPATPEPTGAKSKEEAEANARFADEFGTNLEAMRVKEDEKYEVGMGGFKPATRVNQAASAPILRQARRERKKGNIAVADKLAYEGARMRADEPSIDTEELRAQRAAQKRDTGRAAREQDELAKKAEKIARLDEDDAAHRDKVERDAVKAEEDEEQKERDRAAAVAKIVKSRNNKNA